MKPRVCLVAVAMAVLALPGVFSQQPELPYDRPLRVGFLMVDGVYNSELVAPYDIFHHTVFHAEPGIDWPTETDR